MLFFCNDDYYWLLYVCVSVIVKRYHLLIKTFGVAEEHLQGDVFERRGLAEI